MTEGQQESAKVLADGDGSDDRNADRDDRDDDKAPGFLRRLHDRLHSNPVTGLITKVVISVVGVAVMGLGVFLSGPGIPGPGFLVILGGLAILATEWDWAQRVLDWARARYERARQKVADMDPAERRRRLVLTAAAVFLVAAGLVGYVAAYDWPTFAVDGWDWLQDFSGVVPELPGM